MIVPCAKSKAYTPCAPMSRARSVGTDVSSMRTVVTSSRSASSPFASSSPSPLPSRAASRPIEACDATDTVDLALVPTRAMPSADACANSAQRVGLSNSSSEIHADP